MTDHDKIDAESSNEEQQAKEPSSERKDVTPKSSSSTDESGFPETTESSNMHQPAEEVEKYAEDLHNKRIDSDADADDDGTTKSKEKCEMRMKKHAQEMLHEDLYIYKQKFEELLNKTKVSDADWKGKTYDELCQMLVRPKSLYEARAEFYAAKMQTFVGETLDEYFERLSDLANNCQFGDRRDAVIVDQFILSKSSIYYAFCGEDQKEVCGKTALEISKKCYEKDIVEHRTYLPLSPYRSSYRSSALRKRKEKKCNKVPPHLADRIRNEIMETNLAVEWDDIAGLDFAKSVIKESIVWPMLRPDIFTGLRKLPKAMLLFGPPGTGKTMIAKCIAAQSQATFFYVSASTMASKWHGESEQLVRALFTVAAEHQPSVIFFDEVDSLLTQRKDADHEVSRRVKTEFMIQLDGAATKDDTRVLFIGATNRPQDLDEAARRRFVKRLYVPLPDLAARQQLLRTLLKTHHSNVTDADIKEIATSMTNEFSGADIKWLCQDAAMEPLRSVGDRIKDIDVKDIRPLEMNDFVESAKRVRPSVASADLTAMAEWDRLYGSNSERADFIDNNHMYS